MYKTTLYPILIQNVQHTILKKNTLVLDLLAIWPNLFPLVAQLFAFSNDVYQMLVPQLMMPVALSKAVLAE